MTDDEFAEALKAMSDEDRSKLTDWMESMWSDNLTKFAIPPTTMSDEQKRVFSWNVFSESGYQDAVDALKNRGDAA